MTSLPYGVAFVTNVVPPYRVPFFRELSQLPYVDLHVIHGFATPENGRASVDPATQLPFATERVANHEGCVGSLAIRFQRGALRAIRQIKPDVVVVGGMSGTVSNWLIAIWTRVTRRRLVMWVCGWEAQERGTLAYRLKHVVTRRYYGLADQCLAYSSNGAAYLVRIGVPRDRVAVCYNGIEIADRQARQETVLMAARRLRATAQLEERTLFLYVGVMLREKQVDLVLEAYQQVAAVAHVGLWLVGGGPDLDRVRGRVGELDLDHVTLFGSVADSDPYFAAADCFVLPGLGGLALNQALFYRVPCVCASADGTEEDLVVDGVTGYRFVKGSVVDLAAAMSRVTQMRGTPRWAEMGNTGRSLVTRRSNTSEMVRTFGKVVSDQSIR